jgi:hypothetical protein
MDGEEASVTVPEFPAEDSDSSPACEMDVARRKAEKANASVLDKCMGTHSQ